MDKDYLTLKRAPIGPNEEDYDVLFDGVLVGRIVIAAAVVTTMFVLPADARAKKQKRPAVVQTQQVPSLDGRITGRMRTCGFDLLQYDRRGMPYGPYCHCPAAPPALGERRHRGLARGRVTMSG